MKRVELEKAVLKLKELKNLERCEEMLEGVSSHFKIVKHHGDCEKQIHHIKIPSKYNEKLLNTINEIIEELNTELEVL